MIEEETDTVFILKNAIIRNGGLRDSLHQFFISAAGTNLLQFQRKRTDTIIITKNIELENVVFAPCGHYCSCESCATQINNNQNKNKGTSSY